MRQTIQISINKEIWAKADAEFHFRYGAAMSAWNSLERPSMYGSWELPSPSGEGRLAGLRRVLCNSAYGQQ
jgi:hypothetical protein